MWSLHLFLWCVDWCTTECVWQTLYRLSNVQLSIVSLCRHTMEWHFHHRHFTLPLFIVIIIVISLFLSVHSAFPFLFITFSVLHSFCGRSLFILSQTNETHIAYNGQHGMRAPQTTITTLINFIISLRNQKEEMNVHPADNEFHDTQCVHYASLCARISHFHRHISRALQFNFSPIFFLFLFSRHTRDLIKF